MAEDHYSLSAKVFHSIREDILNGKYQANEELKEKNIGDDLGVSRTPVREALRQLELEGLVHIIPNKGAFVEGVTLQDIKDIYEIRTLLEGLCAVGSGADHAGTVGGTGRNRIFIRFSLFQRKLGSDTGTG